MYQSGRFFVMTGNICAEYADITDCTDSIKYLHEKYIGGGNEPAVIKTTISTNLHVDEILATIRTSKQSYAFDKLYSGDYSGYSSQSEADMALCNMLAFWCGRDADKMDTLYRQSGLMRPKWDRHQSGSTYGNITIQKAINGCRNIYEQKTTQSDYRLNFVKDIPKTVSKEYKPKMYSFDDTGNAARIVDLFGEQIRFYYTDKAWMYYDDLS